MLKTKKHGKATKDAAVEEQEVAVGERNQPLNTDESTISGESSLASEGEGESFSEVVNSIRQLASMANMKSLFSDPVIFNRESSSRPRIVPNVNLGGDVKDGWELEPGKLRGRVQIQRDGKSLGGVEDDGEVEESKTTIAALFSISLIYVKERLTLSTYRYRLLIDLFILPPPRNHHLGHRFPTPLSHFRHPQRVSYLS